MKARFIVALIVALSFIGGSVFAAQADNNNSGKAKTTKVAHAKRHHVKRVRHHHKVRKTSMMKKNAAPSKSKAMK